MLFVHVLLSLIGIGSGFVVAWGLLNANRRDTWTAIFLATTAATSVTGFFLPAPHFLPSHGVGIVSLLALAIAIPARYKFQLTGPWRKAYVIGSMLALYLNVFVLVIQLFRRVPALEAAAPTQTEPPFVAAQIAVLVIFAVLTYRAAVKFRDQPIRVA